MKPWNYIEICYGFSVQEITMTLGDFVIMNTRTKFSSSEHSRVQMLGKCSVLVPYHSFHDALGFSREDLCDCPLPAVLQAKI
jgi:hypothetical protein